MIFNRRLFIGGVAATLTVTACKKAGTLTVSAQAQPGANPGSDGQERPLTIFALQMTGSGAFDSSDYFALQNPSAALGSELVRAAQFVVTPGNVATKTLTMEPTTTVVGFVGRFRDPAGKQLRAQTPAPGGNGGVMLSVGPSGLSLQNA